MTGEWEEKVATETTFWIDVGREKEEEQEERKGNGSNKEKEEDYWTGDYILLLQARGGRSLLREEEELQVWEWNK